MGRCPLVDLIIVRIVFVAVLSACAYFLKPFQADPMLARVLEDRINLAALAGSDPNQRRGENTGPVVQIGNIEQGELRAPASLDDLLDHLATTTLGAVSHEHVSTDLREELRNGCTDSRASAGDERDFTFERKNHAAGKQAGPSGSKLLYTSENSACPSASLAVCAPLAT